MRATRLTVPALGASMVLLLGACGDDSSSGEDTAADSSASESPSSETPAASETPAPVALIVLAAVGVIGFWGIGTWSAWDHEGATVLTRELKGSTVVLQGADQDTVSDLAKSLIPAEDAPAQEG